MSTFPASDIRVQGLNRRELTPLQFAVVGTVLAVLGSSAIWPAVLTLWNLWTTDALKSIGMVVPLVSLLLILRAWQKLGWEADGSWWGSVLILATVAVVWIREQAILILVVSPHWSTVLPPPSLVLLSYGSGVVLLMGGTRLYRAALFPILLLWFANPIPSRFSLFVDMPLQQVSAHIARMFAQHLGYTLTPDHLRLMFTPSFGMFIAPGCDGIRGSIAMGFVALIAGYVYRFRWYANAFVVMGAILLGYVFNLARLCMLVLYYVVALHFPWLQNKAENGDYVIGAALFLVATLLLFLVIHHLRDSGDANVLEALGVSQRGGLQDSPPRRRFAQLVAMAAIMLLGCVRLARTHAAFLPSPSTISNATVARFPPGLRNYTLERTWNETLDTGLIVYEWAQYTPAGGGAPIAIGVSPVPDWHDPVLCHSVRGETPLWQGQLAAATADVPVNFGSAFYDDGVTQYIEATTMCRGEACGEFATERTHFGFVYGRPEPKSLFSRPKQPVRVLLRVESLDTAMPADSARQELTKDLRVFLASVSVSDLTRPYGSQRLSN
jgi:exosortase J